MEIGNCCWNVGGKGDLDKALEAFDEWVILCGHNSKESPPNAFLWAVLLSNAEYELPTFYKYPASLPTQ